MAAWRWPARSAPTCGYPRKTTDNSKQTKPAVVQKTASPEFEAFYLQQATKEFAEDLDKIRAADDFKNDAVPMLVHALKQGATMFAPAEQARIVEGTSGR
ncbi:uncharacterized protein PpBr36_06677 [Pyricularia pennisetigena]|uniref:uncharacterized protein n=1 Tax=Pyricularia pennisetigena TaxID=1578925 RepID=UPI0011533B6F|nr:uncharacterized protein PpBr36_06677 [Pyricularia pennisetigena]TLS23141.1 hypothetical protein PpBr36_06677 [Pyricularia pennisetigena]